MYFNVNFNVFFKLIKLHLLVSELCRYQARRLAKDLLYVKMPQCYVICTLSVVLKLLHLCCDDVFKISCYLLS